MTPISQMTEQEIRVAVAEAMGWTRIDHGTASHVGGFKSWLGAKFDLCGTPPEDKDKPEDDQAYEFIPDYPTDANAALTLCDALAEQGWNIVIGRREITKEYWTVKFERGYLNMHEATGPTLSIAIARAYLAVVQSQTPTP